jgi:hypothetical protein
MILRGSAGRICHLENVKAYMLYLQQYTKIGEKGSPANGNIDL